MARGPVVPRVVRDRPEMARCSSSSCEIAFAKAAVGEVPLLAGLRSTDLISHRSIAAIRNNLLANVEQTLSVRLSELLRII